MLDNEAERVRVGQVLSLFLAVREQVLNLRAAQLLNCHGPGTYRVDIMFLGALMTVAADD